MIYFASDFHLGVPSPDVSRERERYIIRWLEQIEQDATHLYLVGDVFDFWFDYRKVVPKGFVRLLGKLAELRDGGLPIDFFIGNHDLWMFRYFEDELGIPIHRQPIIAHHGGKTLLIGHGDGLGPGDYGYKFIKKVFAAPFFQWVFRQLHPDLGIRIASGLSATSRNTQSQTVGWLGDEKEWLYQYSKQLSLQQPDIDYFIFGHRHLPLDVLLPDGKSRYLNLGEWLNYRSFARFDGEELHLLYFEQEQLRGYQRR